MSINIRKGLVVAAGAFVLAGGVSVYQIWRSWIRRRSRKLEQRIEDGENPIIIVNGYWYLVI